MDDIAKGGRGHKAPYKTTHQRIPIPIKPVVEKIIKAYRAAYAEGLEENALELLERVEAAIDKPVNKNDEYNLAVRDKQSLLTVRDKQSLLALRDRILKKTRSDKLKAVTRALDEFIQEIS